MLQDKNTFTALDFETANPTKTSICQIGLARFENGILTKELSILVRPPNNFYWSKFVEIHGINPTMTEFEPTLDEIWHIVLPFFEDQNVVAHNGFRFDFPVLRATLAYYNLPYPKFYAIDTFAIYRRGLAFLAGEYDIKLNHHDALSDALACAELYRIHLAEGKKDI
jgi:DNA polymerase III subunit epsilon